MSYHESEFPTPDPPIEQVIGEHVEPVATRYEKQGLTVEIHDLNAEVNHDLNFQRIRLFIHDGLVVSVTQG